MVIFRGFFLWVQNFDTAVHIRGKSQIRGLKIKPVAVAFHFIQQNTEHRHKQVLGH
jgi:hypothetical protein